MAKKFRVVTTLDQEDYDALTDLADKLDVTQAWLSRHAIKMILQKNEKDYGQLSLDLDKIKS